MTNKSRRVEALEYTAEKLGNIKKDKVMLFCDIDDPTLWYRFLHRKTERMTKQEARDKFKGFDIKWITNIEVRKSRIDKVNKLMANFANKEN